MKERLLLVSCQIPQNRVYDLLRALEAAKVGNVEVRPVVAYVEKVREVVDPASLPSLKLNGKKRPRRRKINGHLDVHTIRYRVTQAMTMGREVGMKELAMELGENIKSVGSAIYKLVQLGLVKNVGNGRYTRVKEQ
jgi:hypothetical protein